MAEFIAFLIDHWMLSSLFLVLLAILIATEARKSTGIKQISPQQAVDLYNNHQAVILDIRSKEAYADGHVVGAQHFESSKTLDAKKLKKFQKKTIILVAEGASQAKLASKALSEQGLEQLVIMEGGISGWVSAGLPLTKK